MNRESVFVSAVEGELICIIVPSNEPKWFSSVEIIDKSARYEPNVEINGFRLSLSEEYHLMEGECVILHSWSHSVIKITGSQTLLQNIYISNRSNLCKALVEFNIIFHKYRLLKSSKNNLPSSCPAVVVYGENSLINNFVARTLCNYSTHSRWQPMLIDLDCSVQQSISLPGSIAMSFIDSPLSPDEPLSLSALSVSYFIGTILYEHNLHNNETILQRAYLESVMHIANVMKKRFQEQREIVNKFSGAIIILPFFNGANACTHIQQLANIFDATHILCTDDNDEVVNKLITWCRERNNESIFEHNLGVHCYRLPTTHLNFPLYKNAENLSKIYDNFFFSYGPVTLQPFVWSKSFSEVVLFQISSAKGSFSIVPLKKESLQSIIGCVIAIHLGTLSEMTAFLAPPKAYGRIQAINAAGVFVMTNAQYIGDNLTFVVGTVRWLKTESV